MKKLLFILSLLGLVSLPLVADDTIYGLSGGALVQTTDKHPSVYMLNEVINIDVYENYYETVAVKKYIQKMPIPFLLLLKAEKPQPEFNIKLIMILTGTLDIIMALELPGRVKFRQ